jgi:hypothetical protein
MGGIVRPSGWLVGLSGLRSVIEIAEAERISKIYVSCILRLALLILGGWVDQRVMLEQLERPRARENPISAKREP